VKEDINLIFEKEFLGRRTPGNVILKMSSGSLGGYVFGLDWITKYLLINEMFLLNYNCTGRILSSRALHLKRVPVKFSLSDCTLSVLVSTNFLDILCLIQYVKRIYDTRSGESRGLNTILSFFHHLAISQTTMVIALYIIRLPTESRYTLLNGICTLGMTLPGLDVLGVHGCTLPTIITLTIDATPLVAR